ncbi:MAG: 2,3-bisphosphoglycerate-independent phosphoglycerate mutase [Magnetococcales bacterium]|nr:2,3-bisphosphoglycerate-independent phosphoglycerate mutase [Magnetococcales bacterium]MBF0440132.1 2,3-bisphosphoglycerate-independent phosphoglycerate mutase [Magnetococcales bacterium]
MRPKPMILIVLDGWGMRQATQDNAIHHATTPHFDHWWQTRPHALLATCGGDVGLPDGQMGNSEVGHANLGAGRILYQDFTRIDRATRTGGLAEIPAFIQSANRAKATGGAIHICGLLSPGGVHSHSDHLLAAVATARSLGVEKIWIHAFLDGRDVPPRSALDYLDPFQTQLTAMKAGRIASVCGRYWVMDRDKRWDRVARAYALLTQGIGERAVDAHAAVTAAYSRGEDDEFVQPTLITDPQGIGTTLADGDVVWMMNFRADRVREISHALLDSDFTGFTRAARPALAGYLTLTEYDPTLPEVLVAFPPQTPVNTLGEILAHHGLQQLRAAETEKYAHVTYFFNGGQEVCFTGEDRLLIPSPRVATYDLQPEMSAIELTQSVLERIDSGRYDFIVVNYANPDMVGHTGHFHATVKAIETVDHCLGQLADAALAIGGELLITADHGNADCMMGESGQPHTAHTLNPAPLIYLGKRTLHLADGRLCDVAPTVLSLLGLPQPPQMEGNSLAIRMSPH